MYVRGGSQDYVPHNDGLWHWHETRLSRKPAWPAFFLARYFPLNVVRPRAGESKGLFVARDQTSPHPHARGANRNRNASPWPTSRFSPWIASHAAWKVRQGQKLESPYAWSGACAVDLVRRYARSTMPAIHLFVVKLVCGVRDAFGCRGANARRTSCVHIFLSAGGR